MLSAGSPLSDWLTWLETLSPNEIDLGLERVQSVLQRLSLSRPKNVLLVAGTNGKGSSVAMISALLQASGYRFGAYTSPHISRYNERIVVNGITASDEQIIAAFERINAVREGVALTYFEFGTLAAMLVFAETALDVWVLEVGMGGRLDATNVLNPTGSLITNVSLDHCAWLGEDIEAIAFEKAGVMRSGVPTVFASGDVPDVIRQHAADCGAQLLLAGRDFTYKHDSERHWNWTGRERQLERLRNPGLRGEFQVQNAAGVLALLDATGLGNALTNELINSVLPDLALEGRLQSLEVDGASWLLDVAHNPAAAEVLAVALSGSADKIPETWAIIGLLDDKDVEGVVAPLNEHVDHWISVAPRNPRALAAKELARRIANHCNRPCRISDSLFDAMEFARRNAAGNDRILITGSFDLVGPALCKLELYSRPKS
jgi:dihydrofolate synthase/folylpolyglutamate synthase